jgi:hypothetical protein
MTRWYWQQVGGLLIEEFQVVAQGDGNARRLVDALIVHGEPTRIAESRKFDVAGREVTVVQAKARRLGMPLMGQCLFSRDLLWNLGVSTIRSVALCTQDDVVLRPLLEQHDNCFVQVVPTEALTDIA